MTTVVTKLFPDLGPLPFPPGRYFSDTVSKYQLWIYLWPRKIQHVPQNTRPQSVHKMTLTFLLSRQLTSEQLHFQAFYLRCNEVWHLKNVVQEKKAYAGIDKNPSYFFSNLWRCFGSQDHITAKEDSRNLARNLARSSPPARLWLTGWEQPP